MFAIIVATAATLGDGHGAQIASAADAAKALQPVAGHLASVLFAAGFIGSGLLAVPVLAGSASVGIAGLLGREWGFERSPRKAPVFYGLVALGTGDGVVLTHFFSNAIHLLVISALVNGVAAAPFMFVVVLISGDRELMGRQRNGVVASVLDVRVGPEAVAPDGLATPDGWSTSVRRWSATSPGRSSRGCGTGSGPSSRSTGADTTGTLLRDREHRCRRGRAGGDPVCRSHPGGEPHAPGPVPTRRARRRRERPRAFRPQQWVALERCRRSRRSRYSALARSAPRCCRTCFERMSRSSAESGPHKVEYRERSGGQSAGCRRSGNRRRRRQALPDHRTPGGDPRTPAARYGDRECGRRGDDGRGRGRGDASDRRTHRPSSASA